MAPGEGAVCIVSQPCNFMPPLCEDGGQVGGPTMYCLLKIRNNLEQVSMVPDSYKKKKSLT